MSALIYHRSKRKSTVYVCPHCIHPFTVKRAFDNHFDDCAKHIIIKQSDIPKNTRKRVFWHGDHVKRPKDYRLSFMRISNRV
jgi:hypothetical protein